MLQDAIDILSLVFSSIWKLFSSFWIPGTHTTPAEWAIFSLALVFLVRIVRSFFNSSGGDKDS